MNRIKSQMLATKITTPEKAAALIEDGMTVGTSGFTSVNYPKAVPIALAERVRKGEKIKINLITGASVGDQIDGELSRCGIIARRYGFQNNQDLRSAINSGSVLFEDEHISHIPHKLRRGYYGKIDFAIIEACAIDENGNIFPGLSAGITDSLVEAADRIIIEINTSIPESIVGFHDIYTPELAPNTLPIPLTSVTQRIGVPYIRCPLEKIAAIVVSDIMDTTRDLPSPDDNMLLIAQHIISFFEAEIKKNRLTYPLPPIQSGVGGVANAVLSGLNNSQFEHMSLYSEVLQDAVLELIDNGKVDYASGTALTISASRLEAVYSRLKDYQGKIILRPQEISNSPEVIHRLGVIAINTAIEFDLSGNVNSTHIGKTKIMNGIGGSGDYARNAGLSIFTSASTAKNGKISCIVPHVAHVDHTEHDTQIFVTEQGLADLRGLTAYERAEAIIDNCAHPMFAEALREYVRHSRTSSEGQHELA